MINSISDGNNKFLSQFVYIFYSECCFFFEHLREQTEGETFPSLFLPTALYYTVTDKTEALFHS